MRSISLILTFALFVTYLPVPTYAQAARVAIVSPNKGETISGQRSEVSVAYNTGTNEKVTRVEILVDGAPYGVKHIAEPTTRGIVSFLMDTTRIGNGSHTFVVKVFSGNKLIGSTSGSYKIGNHPIDVLAPDLSFVGIKPGDVLKGVATVEIAARDNGRESPLVSVFIDKNLKLIKNVPPYTYEWDTTLYEDGKHVLEACAYDSVGNKSESEKLEVYVRNNTKAIASVKPTPEKTQVAKAPVADSKPIIPISRDSKPAAGRSADVKSTVGGSTNTPAAKPDRPVEVAKAPVAAVQPTTATAVQKEAAINPPKNIETAAKPEIIAVSPEAVVSPSEPTAPEVEAPEVQPMETLVEDPIGTRPEAVGSDKVPSNVIAALPSDITAPASTVLPSIAPPVSTTVHQRAAIDYSSLESVKTESEFGQNLATPNLPSTPKPVKVAFAPKLDVPAAQPSLEPRKVKLTLVTKKLKGVMVTELRYVIESAGGTIISWDHKSKTILAVIEGKKFKLKINDRTAILNGNMMKLTSAPYINANGRTVVDVRFLKSLLGTRLDKDEKSGKWVLVSR